MKTIKSKSKALIGIAGAYFVAAELSQKGYIATVTSRNTEGIDIFASNITGAKVVSIQVKTSGSEQRKNFTRSWHMSPKHEEIYSNSLFYVFVDLNGENQMPDFYIVPSKIVADYLKYKYPETPKNLSEAERKAKKEKSDFRLFEIYDDKEADKYYNKWSNLGLD